jgi:hypothetical protein
LEKLEEESYSAARQRSANRGVTFRWRDSADHNKQKLLPLAVDEFLRRWITSIQRT